VRQILTDIINVQNFDDVLPTTLGLAKWGRTEAVFQLLFFNCAFVPAGRFSIKLLLLTSTSVFQLGFGLPGRTEQYFPHFAKPCPLVAIFKQHLHHK
jgi:hypothetical protein